MNEFRPCVSARRQSATKGLLRKARVLLSAAAVCIATTAGMHQAYAEDVTISLRFCDPDAEGVKLALQHFEQAHPGVHVELLRLTWGEALQQYLREYATGEGPDVLHLGGVWPHTMGLQGSLLPLDDFVKKTGLHEGPDDFLMRDLASADGKLYAVPWTADTWSMIYRTDIFEQVGIKTLPKTWDELLEASRVIHAKTGKTGFGLPMGSASTNTIWLLANYYWWSNGVSLIDSDGQGGFKIGVTADDIAKAMRYYKTYLDEGLMPEGFLSLNSWFDPVIIDGLANGNIAAGVMPPPNLRSVIAAYREKHPDGPLPFATAATPSGSFKPQSHLGGKMLGINPNTKHPDLAWDLVNFLTSEQVLTKDYTNEWPAQYSLLKKVSVEPWLQGTMTQLQNYARSWGAYNESPIPIPSMWNETGRAFGAAFVGQKSVDEAAADFLQFLKNGLNKKP